jgi:hypothetical protein
VVANGGLISLSGTHMLAQAAKKHSVPFVVCTGLYKLCPLYPHDQDTFNELMSPHEILKFEDVDTVEYVNVKNPAWDYIPPELIGLYVTNTYVFICSYNSQQCPRTDLFVVGAVTIRRTFIDYSPSTTTPKIKMYSLHRYACSLLINIMYIARVEARDLKAHVRAVA